MGFNKEMTFDKYVPVKSYKDIAKLLLNEFEDHMLMRGYSYSGICFALFKMVELVVISEYERDLFDIEMRKKLWFRNWWYSKVVGNGWLWKEVRKNIKGSDRFYRRRLRWLKRQVK